MKMVREFERKLAAAALARDPDLSRFYDTHQLTVEDLDRLGDRSRTATFQAVPGAGATGPTSGPATGPTAGPATGSSGSGRGGRGTGTLAGEPAPVTPDRTEMLLNQGRGSAYHPSRWRQRRYLIGGAAALLAVIIVVVTIVLSGGASWPSSVGTVKSEITTACENPDVMSEPGQVNFACGKQTQQILWVFSLLSSQNNPNFHDGTTGREGLEPISPTQGAEVAWSLNLHHPYDPMNPIDSLQVAARAINNIVGGASAIGSNGSPSIQPGLESNAANCLRYTGSAQLRSRPGFPDVCAQPVSTTEQKAALVGDIWKKWAVGASAQQAQAAQVLFENAGDPGNGQVQLILKNLSATRL